MDIFYFGNALRSWCFAGGITLLCFCALVILRQVVLINLRRSTRKNLRLTEDFIEVAKATKYHSLIAASMFFGSQFLMMDHGTRTAIEKGGLIVLLFQCCFWGNKGISFWADSYVKKESLTDPSDTTTVGLLSFSAKFAFYSIMILAALRGLGFNVNTLIAGLGLGGVALALAVQSILADLFACFTIKLDKPYVNGDFIVINEYMGTIEHVGLKTTRLRSLSGEQLIFSNADLLHSRVRNYKRMTERRVSLFLGVTFQTPEAKLSQIPNRIQEIVSSFKNVRFERCHFLRFGPHSFDHELVYWVQSPDYLLHADLAQKINISIVHYFNSEDIEFAYPSQTLYLGQKDKSPPLSRSAVQPYSEPPSV